MSAVADRPQPAWGSLPFQQAIDFFQNKGLVPTERWSDLLGEGHDTGFMVAGITKADLLADLHRSVLKAMTDGTPLKTWQADFDALCDKYGWEPKQGREWRAKIILEHNIRTAYQAGRYRQMRDPALAKAMPYWIYRHSDSARVPRPLHVAWNGLVLLADHPWFKSHFPPNGWGCKCRVFPITRQELARMGRSGPDEPPDDGFREWKNPSTGKTLLVPRGIDPGWDYCPGATPMTEQTSAVAEKKIAVLPEPLAKVVKKDMAIKPRRRLSVDSAIKLGEQIWRELDGQIDPNVSDVWYQEEWHRLLTDKLKRDVAAGSVPLRVGREGQLAEFRKVVTDAANLLPASWIKASNAVGGVSAAVAGSGRAYYVWQWGDGIISLSPEDGLWTASHELAHHMQRVMPGMDSIFQACHRTRTKGEELVQLAKLEPWSAYKNNEIARPDKYLSPYFGKEYIGYGALEMLPMSLGVAMGLDECIYVRDAMRKDPGILHLSLGVLFGYKP